MRDRRSVSTRSRGTQTGQAAVHDALRALPVANLVFDERGSLRALVNVYVDGVDARDRDGLATKLAGPETIRLVAAIAGG